jgi:hypothetical protein
MSVLRIEKLIKFLKMHFENGIQMFNTPSIMPDFRVPIYDKDDILVWFAPEYEYIEIYGISDKEFKRVMKEAGGY